MKHQYVYVERPSTNSFLRLKLPGVMDIVQINQYIEKRLPGWFYVENLNQLQYESE